MPAEEGLDQEAWCALSGSEPEVNSKLTSGSERGSGSAALDQAEKVPLETSCFLSTPYPNAFEDRSDDAQPQI